MPASSKIHWSHGDEQGGHMKDLTSLKYLAFVTCTGAGKPAPTAAAALRCKKRRRESRALFISDHLPITKEHRGQPTCDDCDRRGHHRNWSRLELFDDS